MLLARSLGALALLLAVAAPASAARIDLAATLAAKPGKPFTGEIDTAFGTLPFALDTMVFSATADTGAVTSSGSVRSVTLDSAWMTATLPILGPVTIDVLDTLTAQFDTATSVFSLSKGGTAFVTATPGAGFAWDLVSTLPLTPVGYVVGATFAINTSAGLLEFDLGPDGDGTATGAIAAAVAPVPLPAAAPLLLAAVGLLGLGRARRA